MNLTEHFTLKELTKSQTSERLGIDNQPDSEQMLKLRLLCSNILEPIREAFNIPFTPSSGFRSYDLNAKIGGSFNSQHCRGEAADIELPGVSNLELAFWIKDNINFDQVILECWDGTPESGWIHVSFATQPRFDILTFNKKQGYKKGFPE